MAVFVLDRGKKPLMPCTEKRARLLLDRGRAVVHRIRPFTIRLKDRRVGDSALQALRLKLDPGSRITGIAVVQENTNDSTRQKVKFLAALHHRGDTIRDALVRRRTFRQCRRVRNLRHREKRGKNRRSPRGWLPPSLRHRVETTTSWVDRLRRLVPLLAIDLELVRFDTQALNSPDIQGAEYRQGTLHGFELREYLLAKWERTCAYCGATGLPLQIDHIHPRSRGGSDRIGNLTLACAACNQAKGQQPAIVFLRHDPERLARIRSQISRPLRDAAAVNSTRWSLFQQLQRIGLPVMHSTGGRTKWNRTRLSVPKTHALDAACVGEVTALENWQQPTLIIRAMGRGRYQRTLVDRYGFPRGYLMRAKQTKGFQTGDLVVAEVTAGKKMGSYQGRVAINRVGSFSIQTANGIVQGVSYRYCRLLQRGDGYGYWFKPAHEETGLQVTPSDFPQSSAVTSCEAPQSMEDQHSLKPYTVNVRKRLTLLQRKVANALLLNAYDALLSRESHTIRLAILADQIGFHSHHHALLRDALTALVATPVEWTRLDEDGKEVWGVTTMLASARLHLGTGQCEYSYSRDLRERLYNPDIYARINLAIQRRFTSGYALALYENCIRYRRIGSTGWWSLDIFRELMGVGDDEYPQFKELNRRVIRPAVEQVNADSDIQLDVELQRKQRQVTALRFAVRDNPQLRLFQSPEQVLEELRQDTEAIPGAVESGPSNELMATLEDAGVGARQARRLVRDCDADRIQRNLALFKADCEAGRVTRNPGGYLIRAIREDFAASRTHQPSTTENGDTTPPSPDSDPVLTAEALAGYQVYRNGIRFAAYQALAQVERQALERDFGATLRNPVDQRMLADRGIEGDRRLREQFAEFLERGKVGKPMEFRAWATGEGYQLALDGAAEGHQVAARIEKS